MRSLTEKSRENRFRAHLRPRPASARKSNLRRIALENLEPRTLLAVLPPATHDPIAPDPIQIESSGGNHSTPTVTVDPTDPLHLAAAWVRFDPNLAPAPQVIVEAATSTDGGANWTAVPRPSIINDPTTSNPVLPYPQATDPTIAFDRSGNFYLLVFEHNGTSSGAAVLTKYSGTSKVLTTTVFDTDNQVPSAPMLAVDDNVPNFTDPTTGAAQNDPFSGNVYVAWAGNDTAPANNTDPVHFNPNRIKIVASSDGGQTFGPVQTVDDAGNIGLQRFGTPRLTVSQGRPAGNNGPAIPAGQVSVVWDDFGSGATAVPIPFDVLDANRVQSGTSEAFAGTTGAIADAIDPGNGAPHVPVTTTFTANVGVDPRFTTLSDLDVTLNLLASNLADLKIDLVAPDGTVVTLMQNQVNAAGNTISQFVGSTGANLGINGNGFALGTTFDQEAVRAFVDINATGTGRGAAAPYIGSFRPDTGGGNNLKVYNGRSAAAVNGTWSLRITDIRNDGTTPPPQVLLNWSIKIASGVTTGSDSVVSSENTVRGAAPTGTSADPLGITPGLTIASDNTLGSFSPHEGRLYAVYVDRYDTRRDGGLALGNPADNTDIFIKTSDDGGLTWQSPHNFVFPGGFFSLQEPVNDDSAIHDGFSEATSISDLFTAGTSAHMSGRPQFQPAVAVDQTTGTLVISYYDARYDAARARVATTIATSIDGGQTFGPQTFANTPVAPLDEVTQQTTVLAPIPDNQSGGNPKTEGTFSYGTRQGLAVSAGHIYPTWSSNENGGLVTGNNSNALDIRVAPLDIAAGPRVIASTMGPVGLPGDPLNGTPTSDGSPQAQSLEVTFDRPVNPSTVTGSSGLPQVTVFQANFETGADGFTIDNTGPDGQANTADDGLWHLSTGRGNNAGHSPTHSMYYGKGETASGGGTYDTGFRNAGTLTSPAIALPTGRSLSLSFNYFLQTEGDASFFDEARVTVVDLSNGNSTVIAQNNTGNLLDPSNGFQTFTADLSSFAGDTVQLVFSFDTEDPLFNAFEGWYVDDVSIVQPAIPPTIQILARDVNGVPLATQPTVTAVTPVSFGPFGATTLKIDFTPVNTPGTVSYTIGPDVADMIRTVNQSGNLMDQNSNAAPGEAVGDLYADPRPLSGTPFQPPYDSTTLPLIIPGPHMLGSRAVMSNGQEAPASSDNLVLNNTVSGIDVTFDRDMDPSTFTPAQVLQILGPAGPLKLTNANGTSLITITPNPNNTDPDPTHPRTFRIGLPTQELSGTYTVLLGSGIKDKHGNAVDTNLNAGLDALRGNPTTGVTTQFTATSTNVPITIAPGRTVTSTIDVTDNFAIQGLTLQLNITDAHDPDLEASLLAPDGVTVIKLFTNVGATGTQANFNNTVFDDSAVTPIQNGPAPFFGRFNPQQPLSILKNTNSIGRYTLQIKNDSSVRSGTLNSWSLTFLKPQPATGLGEQAADRSQASFRIFTMDPTNPLSSNTWTAVGPASIGQTTGVTNAEGNVQGSRAGRIGGLALDPSDPSGNTVFVAGATGGVWKTTNFLTTDPQGPTYVPLTNFGPTFAMNIGGLAVFGRNNDPNQSIVFAATGEGDTGGGEGLNGSAGVGVLRSTDGGATWQVLDSLTNVDKTGNPLPLTGAATDGTKRDHTFVGTVSFKILVDPRPSPSGQVIVYLALGGLKNGGVYRSLDSGDHWQLMRAGDVTDLTLDPNSGFVNAVSNPTGNLQIIYAGFRGEGVFISSNQGQGWSLLGGGGGDPLIQDIDKNPPPPVNVAQDSNSPNGAKGRIVLAKPALTGDPLQDLLYEGWLYAGVATTGGTLDGLYMTKDFGRNWTKIHLANHTSGTTNAPGLIEAVPTNDSTQADFSVVGNANFAQGNYDISLAIDPVNPNVVYFGGTADGNPSGLIRVDTTGISDPYSLYMANTNPDGGQIEAATTDPATLDVTTQPPLTFFPPPNVYDPRTSPTINFIQDPANPFVIGATHYVTNTTTIANSGADAKWIPFDEPLSGSTDQHRVFSFKDPLTGQARIVFGDDQGVFTGVDAGDGTLIQSVGSVSDLSSTSGDVTIPTGSRNGNLQITQFYYGAAQPSNLAAQVAVLRGLFYGSAQDDGAPQSDPNIIGDPTQPGYGNLIWTGPGGDYGGVATDQTGSGNVYQYAWPCCGGNITDFFQFNEVGRTTGLLQVSQPGLVPDPQWPFLGEINFAINPINGDQAVISSATGRIFRTETQGKFWLPIADPSTLDSTISLAQAYGAPDPNAPGGIGSLDNFIYVGTEAGHIFVTFTGGGPTGQQWTDISAGLDGSPVRAIITNPTRGNHEAYAVTTTGVFHMVDSAASGATWQNISGTGAGNIFKLAYNAFGTSLYADRQAAYLTSIQADWRYVIPDDFNNPTGPTHPMLFVSGEGGVYRSLDNGKTWTHFPDVALNSTPQEPTGPNQPTNADPNGGYLPNVQVTDLDLSLGDINPTTGRPVVNSSSPNVLLASTYGRGAYAIRLAPITFPNTTANPNIIHFDLTLPNPPGPPNGSDSGVIGDGITNVTDPVIDGLSEQSAFGNVVNISIVDLTNPNNPVPIPTVAGTTQTDTFGHFAVQIAPGYFKNDGSTDGIHTIGLQATDQSGTKGNIATFTFTLNTRPPGAPGTPALDPNLPAPGGSDSGPLKTDKITNVTSPVLDVLPSGPNIIGQTVELLRDGVVVATAHIPAGAVAGIVKLTDTGPVSPDGQHTYTAMQVDDAGNTSPASQSLVVTFDTVPPNTPSTPTLDPNDDTGTKGDGKTRNTQPHLDGTIVPETVDPIAQVQIIDNNNNVLGTANITVISPTSATYSVQFANSLANGGYAVRVRAEDIAGNFSSPSGVFNLTIENLQPNQLATPSLFLLSTDDSGIKGDNITNVSGVPPHPGPPHIVGTADPGLFVDLIDVDGKITGTPNSVIRSGQADANGNYIIQFPAPLPDNTYHIQVQARDAFGNVSNPSATLTLVIDTTPPATAPTLGLANADDTGVKGDGVTTVRRPHLVGTTEPNGFVDIIDSKGNVLATAIANASGSYSAQLANNLTNGLIGLRSRATDAAGNIGPVSSPFNLTVITVKGDYDLDGKADLALFRPSAFQWLISQSTAGPKVVPFGGPGDLALQGDFDGDGQTDLTVYRPSTAQWFILKSQRGPFGTSFGQPNVDVPAPSDYDGDGQTDLAVYRPTTGQWFVLQSSGGGKVVSFGWPGVDRPEPADYDGDGKSDIAVYRPTTGQWLILGTKVGPEVLQVGGQAGDIAVPGNYDGPTKVEPAVYRPSTGQWLILGPSGTRTITLGGRAGDIAVPGDYDGTGQTEPAIFRPSTGQWLIMGANGLRTVVFGGPSDTPVAEAADYHSATFGLKSLSTGGGSGGLRAASFNLGSQALGLAASGSSSLSVPMGAPVVVPPPTTLATTNALTTVTPPVAPPVAPPVQLTHGTPIGHRSIKVVPHGLHQAENHQARHTSPVHNHHDKALASLNFRVKAGRLLPGHGA